MDVKLGEAHVERGVLFCLEGKMGDASDIACVRSIHAGERITPHRTFDLHARVHAGRVHLTATDSSISCFDRLHMGLSARASSTRA